MDYNCQDHKILNSGHSKNFVSAYTGWGAFHHVRPAFINAYNVSG